MENSTGKPTTAFRRRPQFKEFSLLENKLQDQFVSPICLPLDFLEAITNDFSEEQELGRGGFGVVYKGILQNGEAIAVKKLSEMHLDDAQFQNEVTYLIGLKHQNIIKLVGYCAESRWEVAQVGRKYVMAEVRKRMLCFQYMNNKSLDYHISVPTTQSDGFGWRIIYEIIIGICCGLHYLHTECQIVHLDLKPQNILLDDHMEPKIADFGMSRLFGQQQSRIITETRGGTLGYMAPEYLANGLISSKNDIFSLGVIIMELMTGCRDYPSTEGSYENFVENVVGSWRKRLEESYKSVERYVEQIKMCIFMGLMCVNTDPNKRPTAQDIVDKLTKQDAMNIIIGGSPEKQSVHFYGPIGFTLEDLLGAEVDVLGRNTYWTVYKARMEDGSLVAVRRFKWDTTRGHNEFEDEVAVLGSIRHPNLLPLIACYVGLDEKLIVFDYMPRGSLFAFMHGDLARAMMTASWETRMEIAKGTARGLAFLHDDMSIIHGNLTTSNVLLDVEFHPKIGYFGLFRLMTTAANSKLLRVATEMGYRAPELSNLMMATTETDVYSLGIIILELLTGKLPSNMDLQWMAASVHVGAETDVFDVDLMDEDAGPSVDELVGTLKLALQCVDSSPSVRPQARDVLRELEKIRPVHKNGTRLGRDTSPLVQLETRDVAAEQVYPGPEDVDGTSEDLSPSEQQSPGIFKLVHFDGPTGFTMDDLLRADAGVLGTNRYGMVSKASLEDGSIVVVWRLKSEMTKAHEEFKVQVTALGSFRHPNLLTLIAYYVSLDEKLIVFNYMRGGSLFALLHEPSASAVSTPPDWAKRMEIIKGIASGLSFLHDDMNIIHGNLTPWTVLLDEQSHPKIADFWFLCLMTTAADDSEVVLTARELHYRAPEMSSPKEASAKTDVYSLGIIILELLTGKVPRSEDLQRWVAREWWSNMFDQELMRDDDAGPSGFELEGTLMLALQCVDPVPSMRPHSQEVLWKLDMICRGPESATGPIEGRANKFQLMHFNELIWFTIEELLHMDVEVLETNRYGTVYKARLKNDGSCLVVIWRLKSEMTMFHELEEFKAEVAVLGSFRHPNLLTPIACYASPDERLFLFDYYMHGGSLFTLLHEPSASATSTPPDWAKRMEIIKGIASGLTFLHDNMNIIHGNLTAWTVLLNKESHPKIADFWFSRLMTTAADDSEVFPAARELRYRAPEMSSPKEASVKTDVYSLGIIILELLTGKLPRSEDLQRWVAREWSSDMFDQELIRDDHASPSRFELKGTLKLALQCVDPIPSVRPQAQEVLQKLEKICPGPESGTGPSEDPSSQHANTFQPQLVHFDGPTEFTIEDLLRADAEVLGTNMYGTVYKAELEDDGSAVVVWRLKQKMIKAHEEFKAEVELLGSFRHPNLLTPIAYHVSLDEKLLVFDYMHGGSLSALFHESSASAMSTPPDWAKRVEIIKGIASGLTFLHDNMNIINGNLAPWTVLLDKQSHPKIADFWFSRLMTTAADDPEVFPAARELCYRAPEMSSPNEASAKTDVYSLGIIILELLTGKVPRSEDLHLQWWREREWSSKLFDQELMRDGHARPSGFELKGTVTLALQCVSPIPSVRPQAQEVLRKLEKICRRPESATGPSEDPSSQHANTFQSSSKGGGFFHRLFFRPTRQHHRKK